MFAVMVTAFLDKTRRQGEEEKRRQGDKEKGREALSLGRGLKTALTGADLVYRFHADP
jgi:hypothetical protein